MSRRLERKIRQLGIEIYRVQFRKFHKDNCGPDLLACESEKYYFISPYITQCEIFTNIGPFIAEAICGPNDQPNRKRGNYIAYGRALKSILTSTNTFSTIEII